MAALVGGLIDYVTGFVTTRQAELTSAYAMGLTAYETKSLPDMSDVSGSMMATTVAAMLLANAALMSLTSGGRKVVSNAIEAVITFVLLIVLILLVLGVPVGFMYTGFLVVKYAWIFLSPFVFQYGGAAIDFVKAKLA